jgi:putative transposase
MKTIKIRIKNDKEIKFLKDYIFKTRHFENILIILLKTNKDDFNYLSNYSILRAVLTNSKGGKQSEKVEYIKTKYKDNQLMNELILVSKELKVHNLCLIIDRIKTQYKTFFKYPKDFKPPKPKSLSKLTQYSILIDGYTSFSLKKKNKIGINLNKKMFYFHINHTNLLNLIKDFIEVKTVTVNYSNGYLYFNIIYNEKQTKIITENKIASIDLGLNNLLTLFVNDKIEKSIIISGNKYKHFNNKFNRFIAKLNNFISKFDKYSKRKKYLIKYRSFLYEKRNNFFFSEFHIISKNIVEYLKLNKINKLIISKNLGSLKNNGNCNLGKNTQTFIQIPFMKLISNIEYKANDLGIEVININESYTSKCSCISDDVNKIKETKMTNDLNGNRVKRGLFKDKLISKVFNADINGAVNHIKVYTKENFDWLQEYLFKLCNPIKFKSNYEFKLYLNSKVG